MKLLIVIVGKYYDYNLITNLISRQEHIRSPS